MQKLYKFHLVCGKLGYIDGLFIADDDEVGLLSGKTIYFGEVSGRWLETYEIIDESNLTIITDDCHEIKRLKALFGTNTLCGCNPLMYNAVD